MEILQIAGGRMKITLSGEDLSEYAIDCKEMDYDSPQSRKALDAVLAVVEAKTGVNMKEGRLYIQFYPSKDGGCEIFIMQRNAEEQAGCAMLPASLPKGGYLCTAGTLDMLDREEEESAKELFERVGLKGEWFFDRQSRKLYLWCQAEENDVLMLEEFGYKAESSLEIYLSEHFVSLGKTGGPRETER